MQGDSPEHGRPRRGSAVIVALAGLLIARAAPLAGAYIRKLRALHAPGSLLLAAAAALAALALLTLALKRRPGAAVAALGALGLATTAAAGNAVPLVGAAIVLGATLLLGDLVARLLRGAEPEWAASGLATALAAGQVAAGLLVLSLAGAGLLSRRAVAIAALALVLARAKRALRLARLARDRVRSVAPAPTWPEAAWWAFAAAVVLACWAAAQAPDTSWDALAYHLPEARGIAATGRVEAAPDLAPQSLLWHNHEAYLALGFLAGGERAAGFLQFALGVAVFAASLSLARRLSAGAASPLIALALAAFPPAMFQLHAAYVDWPAALLVTCAAAQLARRSGPSGADARLAGFFLGGAVVIKIFAVFALPALALLARRARLPGRAAAAACLCAAIPIVPWAAWSHARAGSVFAPYADSPAQLLARVARGHYFSTSPASGGVLPARSAKQVALGVVRLPYDVVFHSSRFDGNGDGYDGILALLLLLGVTGWGATGARAFALAALPFLIPWSLLALPSIRFLIPVYPLYAVFTAEGLRRLAAGFRGPRGTAAALAILAVAAIFPVQLGSSGDEWRVAAGRMTREQFLAARLPSWTLWPEVGAADRVLLAGENDRYHCPAAAAWRSNYLPPAAWRDRAAWERGLAELGITLVLWRSDRDPRLPDGFPQDSLSPVARSGPAALFRLPR